MKKLNSGKPPKRCRCPQVGFKLMQDDGRVFKCYDNMWDTIFYSELGSSLSILRGGYNLDSFMARYQGVDWTEEANWECNSRRARSRCARKSRPRPCPSAAPSSRPGTSRTVI